MSQLEFDKQITIYDLKIYILQNNIVSEGEFFIYVNTKCSMEIQAIVNKNVRVFKSFIKGLRNNPERTRALFRKERELFALKNSAGIENGIKIKKILQEI